MPDERTRWNDDRLDDLSQTVRAIAPVVQSAAVQATQIEDMKNALAGLEKRIDALFNLIEADQQARRSSRTQVLGVIIASSLGLIGVVLAAIITTGGHP